MMNGKLVFRRIYADRQVSRHDYGIMMVQPAFMFVYMYFLYTYFLQMWLGGD